MKEPKRFLSYSVKLAATFFFLIGCARVSVESKEPIKLDVTMRLDIYQHVAKDADAIEDMVNAPAPAPGPVSASWFGVTEAYAADEGYSPEVQAAIERRQQRRADLNRLEARGELGENAEGFVEVRGGGDDARALAQQENKDRRLIYAFVAEKNGTSVESAGAVFAQRIQRDAASGTPIEVSEGGATRWMVK